MKKDLRGYVVTLLGRKIPHDADGDPAFAQLGIHQDEVPAAPEGSILSQFTPEEVVFMVNRYLYQCEYQRQVHRKRSAEERENLQPIKDMVFEMFGIRWTKASEEQIKAAADTVAKLRRIRRGEGPGGGTPNVDVTNDQPTGGK